MKLHTGALHVWAVDLDAVDAQTEGLLDERENARAERIVREPVRSRWMAARTVLRMLLGSYLDEHPSVLHFEHDAHGKPSLDHPRTDGLCFNRLRFNLSHSGGLAVYALSEASAVGVDVELLARQSKTRIYKQAFLREWVRREADCKRRGVGVGSASGYTQANDSPSSDDTTPWIADLGLGNVAVGAVALDVNPVDFQVYTADFSARGSILPSRKDNDPHQHVERLQVTTVQEID